MVMSSTQTYGHRYTHKHNVKPLLNQQQKSLSILWIFHQWVRLCRHQIACCVFYWRQSPDPDTQFAVLSHTFRILTHTIVNCVQWDRWRRHRTHEQIFEDHVAERTRLVYMITRKNIHRNADNVANIYLDPFCYCYHLWPPRMHHSWVRISVWSTTDLCMLLCCFRVGITMTDAEVTTLVFYCCDTTRRWSLNKGEESFRQGTPKMSKKREDFFQKRAEH